MLNPTQLERIRRWSQGIPVDEHEYPWWIGAPSHQTDPSLYPRVKELVGDFLTHIREMEQTIGHVRKDAKSRHEYALECKTTRRDENARAAMQGIMTRPGFFGMTDAYHCYEVADLMEKAREKKP